MLQVEYDLMMLAKKIKQEQFDASGGQEMYAYKFGMQKKEAVTEEANTENRNDNLVKVHSEKCTVSIPHKATDCQAKGEEK